MQLKCVTVGLNGNVFQLLGDFVFVPQASTGALPLDPAPRLPRLCSSIKCPLKSPGRRISAATIRQQKVASSA